MEENTKYKGQITEQKCYLKCLEHGYIVSRPIFDSARYDFILDTGKKLLRIQVKTSTWIDAEHTIFSFNGYSQHNIGAGTKRMLYTNKEIDYFMTEKQGTYYLYPANEIGFTQKKLRLSSKQSAQPSIIWAEDYQFEKVCETF